MTQNKTITQCIRDQADAHRILGTVADLAALCICSAGGVRSAVSAINRSGKGYYIASISGVYHVIRRPGDRLTEAEEALVAAYRLLGDGHQLRLDDDAKAALVAYGTGSAAFIFDLSPDGIASLREQLQPVTIDEVTEAVMAMLQGKRAHADVTALVGKYNGQAGVEPLAWPGLPGADADAAHEQRECEVALLRDAGEQDDQEPGGEAAAGLLGVQHSAGKYD